MKTIALTCICCPMGCQMTVQMEKGQVLSVEGNTCKNGDRYARTEVTNPTRIVTSTVRVTGGHLPVVSVKTAAAIPKGKIAACMQELAGMSIAAPVQIGQILLSDVAGTGTALVATRSIRAERK